MSTRKRKPSLQQCTRRSTCGDRVSTKACGEGMHMRASYRTSERQGESGGTYIPRQLRDGRVTNEVRVRRTMNRERQHRGTCRCWWRKTRRAFSIGVEYDVEYEISRDGGLKASCKQRSKTKPTSESKRTELETMNTFASLRGGDMGSNAF